MTKTRNRTRPSSLTLLGKTAATIAIAVVAATLTLSASPSATASTAAAKSTERTVQKTSAAKSHRRAAQKTFAAPTTIVPTKTTCDQVSPDTWKVVTTFRVSGGRYTNLGDPDSKPTFNDNVYRGGKRYIRSVENWHGGKPADANNPVTTYFSFQQRIAPIGQAKNHLNWEYINEDPLVTFTC